jgi:hypothetical protein
MKVYVFLGALALVFIVCLLAALSGDSSPSDKVSKLPSGTLEQVYDKNGPDPEKWVLRVHP